MRTENRPETCDDCGDTIDREWRVQTLGKGVALPKGYRVEKRSQSGDWRTIAAPTHWTTLCLCDAP
jgi:hypothetical protein